MDNSKKYLLLDLIGEIKKLDAMTSLHRDLGKDEFMAAQYDSKKSKLMKELISELTSSAIDSPQVFSMIGKIIFRFYPEDPAKRQSDLDQLVESIY